MRSRGPISADERHSYAEEEIGARPAGVKFSSKESERGDWGRESGRSTGELEAGRRRVTLAEEDQREREGPCRSAIKAQPRNPLSRAAQLSSRSRRPPPVVAPL